MSIQPRIKSFLQAFLSTGHLKQLSNIEKIIFTVIGVCMSLFQIWAVTIAKIDSMIEMAIHLSFILVLTFFLYSPSEKVLNNYFAKVIDYIFIGLAASSGIYYYIHADRISTRIISVDPLTTLDILFGIIFVVLAIEAARRTIGFMIISIALLFILYMLYGHQFSGVLHHREMSFLEVLDQLAFSFNGLWGSPIAIAATFVFMFVLFGTFLQRSGASEFFFQLSIALAGRSRGGAAKIAVIASAFFGAISGSPTANVVTTGAFTIPLAKKTGYSSRFSAAVEAVASTGGSILPPIMGSAAFLMAAVTNTPYHSIAIAALLPAILYYIALFLMIHFEAIRLDLPRADETQIPRVSDVLKRGWFYFIPVLVLITLLLSGYSPSRTGFFGIISIIIISWFQPKKRMKIGEIIQALAEGAKTAIPISSACAAAGLVIAGIMTTGLGGKLSSIILNITSGQLLPSLLLIMIMCIILGMGMPVAAAYVLTAMLAAPTLINLGVGEMAAHLFIVYFSIISAITPPVAVASFAAAGIAKANPTTVGFEAVRLGLVSFIIPFIFVFQPGLLMEGTILDVIITFSVSVLGITALCYLMIFALPKVGHLFHLSVNRN
ncbi:MAG TPA: TRAP transporter fused permease subunit [Bacillota bacterium]|nr:TRAP transporter fused permease subunit [Bacillota bacterium]